VTTVTRSVDGTTRPSLRERAVPHVPGVSVIIASALVIMRRFVFTGGVPAGTDMLGFVSRAAQNASPGRILDAWSPGSFGARRVFTFDNILGAVTMLTRNPMLTVKLFDVVALTGAGVGAYALAWSWFGRRRAATIAGIFYLTSQAVLTRWGSGQLNVEIIIALAPLMILGWSACLSRFSVRRVIAFTFVLGFGCLVRADLMLYVAPFLILYALVALVAAPSRRPVVVNAAKSLAVAVPGVAALNAAWLVPTLTGFRAQYQTLSQIFPTSQLASRSIDIYPSLLGLGREIGYFGFTGTETWSSYPVLPLWAYYAAASVVPLLAFSVLGWRRDARSVFLVLAAVIATMAAPGSRAPLGAIYLWVTRNVPVAGNLRDPNRWLIFQALAYALLAGLALDRCVTATPRWWREHRGRVVPRVLVEWATRAPRAARAVVGLTLLAVALVPIAPTVLVGLRTWHVTSGQRALLTAVSSSRGPAGMVATIPFEQDYRFVVQGSYQGYEHDLGYESTLFTGRGAVGDGSWNQRSANLLAYAAGLLTDGDPAFGRILGSNGVRYLTSFNYPLVAPQLLSPSVGAFTQQATAASMTGLTPVAGNSAGADYAIAGAAAPLTFRSNVAVVLGGNQGIASLADWPGLHLSAWATFTADGVISTKGFGALLGLIRRADLVLMADERPVDIAVEGTTPMARVAGITSDPQLDRLETDVPTDQSAQRGSLYDFASPSPQPLSTTRSSTLHVATARSAEVWVRVLASSQAANVHVAIDGRSVGSVTPVTVGPGGFEWISLGRVFLGAGSHRMTVSATPSSFGDSYEVAEARLVDPTVLTTSESELHRALAASARRVAYAFDLNDVAKWGWTGLASRLAPVGPQAYSAHAWSVPHGANTVIGTVAAPGGTLAESLRAVAGRSVFAVAALHYHVAQDWSDRPYVYLEFKGTGSGSLYTVIFDFGSNGQNEARYVIEDTSRGWRDLAFSTAASGSGGGPSNWSKVTSVRVALESKSAAGSFALGVPLPSVSVNDFTVALPMLTGTAGLRATLHPVCFGPKPAGTLVRRHGNGAIELSIAGANSSCRLDVAPASGFHERPAVAVRLRPAGIERWSYSFTSTHAGVLTWNQAFDPLWQLAESGRAVTGQPVTSLATGFILARGRHAGVLAFAGETSTVVGVIVTLAAAVLLAVLALAMKSGPAADSARSGAVRRRRSRFSRWSRTSWAEATSRGSLVGGLTLIATGPVMSLTGSTPVLAGLSLLALVAFAVSVLLGATSPPADHDADATMSQR